LIGDSGGMAKDSSESDMLLFGCGNMAGAMLSGWLNAGTVAQRFTIVDPGAKSVPPGVHLVQKAPQLDRQFASVLLGVKPQILGQISDDVLNASAADAVIISIMAGVEAGVLQAKFPGRKIVRLMPNLSVSLGLSPLGLWAPQLTSHERADLDRVLSPLGTPEWLDSEAQMDAFTALAGSGPAFVYRFIDALAAGGAETGLPPEQAQRIAMQMTLGAAQLAAQASVGPGTLAQRVASPGGTTAAGLNRLDNDDAMTNLIEETLRAARDRSKQMAQEAAAK